MRQIRHRGYRPPSCSLQLPFNRALAASRIHLAGEVLSFSRSLCLQQALFGARSLRVLQASLSQERYVDLVQEAPWPWELS